MGTEDTGTRGRFSCPLFSPPDDQNFDLAQLDYGNGHSIEYEYDDQGRVTKEIYKDTANEAGETVTYQYDNYGGLAVMTGDNRTVPLSLLACRKSVKVIAMKYCRQTCMSRVVGWLSMLVVMPFGVTLLAIGIYFLMDVNFVASILSFLIGAFLLLIGAKEYTFELRKYLITSEGLYLGNKRNAFYAWAQIYEIGVFYFDAAASLQVYDKVICCSFSPPLANLKHNLFYNTRFYAQRNQNKFVIIDYDEVTMRALSEVCQKNIIDYTAGMKKGHIRNS